MTENATNGAGASVTFLASALDTVDGSIPVTCSPTSGSLFPIGVTTVNCSATDSHQNTSTGSFIITVKGVSNPFTFKVNQLLIDKKLKSFFLLSNFTLGTGNNGINPVQEAVTFKIGNFTATIPAGSFRKVFTALFVYAGTINNVKMEVIITSLGSNTLCLPNSGCRGRFQRNYESGECRSRYRR